MAVGARLALARTKPTAPSRATTGRPYNNVDKMRMTGKSPCHCEAMKWPWQSVLFYTAAPHPRVGDGFPVPPGTNTPSRASDARPYGEAATRQTVGADAHIRPIRTAPSKATVGADIIRPPDTGRTYEVGGTDCHVGAAMPRLLAMTT